MRKFCSTTSTDGKHPQVARRTRCQALRASRYIYSRQSLDSDPAFPTVTDSDTQFSPCWAGSATSVASGVMLELYRRRYRRQHVCAIGIISGLLAVGVGSSRLCADASEGRPSDAPAYGLLAWLAAQLWADRIWAVRNGSTWLEALPLPTSCPWHGSIKCA